MSTAQIAAATEMSALEAIYKRRAVRAYHDRPVSRDTIARLLDAAVRAPTAVREEPWAFAVVQDKSVLKTLSDDAKKTIDELAKDVHPSGGAAPHRFTVPDDVFHGAGTLIVIYGKPMGRFVQADCWLAAENLMLAACALGLGTCVVGLALDALNAPEWKTRLNVPREMTAIAPIVVGTPAGHTPATERREPEILAWR